MLETYMGTEIKKAPRTGGLFVCRSGDKQEGKGMAEPGKRRRQCVARKERLMELLVDPATALLPAGRLAELLGLKPNSLRVYMKDAALMAEVARRRAARADPRLQGLAGVDMAMMKAAQEGNVPAAKLVYARLGSWETPAPVDVAALLEEIEVLKKKLEKVGKG